MRRREFIRGIAGSTVAWPLAVRAQQASNKIPLVGVLWHASSVEEEDVYLSGLVKALHDLGYVEGKNIHLDQRFRPKIRNGSGNWVKNWSTPTLRYLLRSQH
jgi:putative ABC transport system substrate-binding protein